MMKVIVKLRIIFLFIGAIAINAHMIIPHDHHQADSFTGQYNECPVSGNEESHHTGMPVHCHACNDLASEKSVILVTVSHFDCKYFHKGDNIFYKEPVLHLTGFVNNFISLNHPDSDNSADNHLRAPPAFV